jgi:hypothetical protein
VRVVITAGSEHGRTQTMGTDEGPDLPTALGKPALRALAGAGYARLEQVADLDPVELGRLHGVGPKALRLLTEALAARRELTTTSQHDGTP